MNFFGKGKKESKGQRSSADSSGSASINNHPHVTFVGPRNSRRQQLLDQTAQQDVVFHPHQPQSMRQLFNEDGSTMTSPAWSMGPVPLGAHMYLINRQTPSPSLAPTSSTSLASASGSSSSGVQMSPPHYVMPLSVPTISAVDQRGVPISEKLSYITPQQAYVYMLFDTHLYNARVTNASTSELDAGGNKKKDQRSRHRQGF